MATITKPLTALEESNMRGAINAYCADPTKPYQRMVFEDRSHEWYVSLAQQLGMTPPPARVDPSQPPVTPVPPPSDGPVIYMDMDAAFRQDTVNNHTPFAANGILVCKFTVPNGAVPFPVDAQGWLQWAEFVDPIYTRQVSLSDRPCDFRGAPVKEGDPIHIDPTGAAYPRGFAIGGNGNLNYTVNGTLPHTTQLTPGTWYYNIRNWDQYANGGQGGHPNVATCNIVVTFSLPK